MIKEFLRNIYYFIGLLFLQVVVLNNIHLFGYAMPILYVYMLLKLPFNTTRIGIMLWAFFLGLSIDVFSNTLGMNAIASVLIGFLRPFFLSVFEAKEMEHHVPSFSTMGVWKFIKYAFICVLIHHTMLFGLELFSFADVPDLLLKTGASVVLTMGCILLLESTRKK